MSDIINIAAGDINLPVVSVLMTAYNREKLIAMAIESVLASTYRQFELIIVDDCSTDGTREIIQSYSEKDGRIRPYYNENNLGDYPNRNLAASYATGIYIKYVDSDDYIYPNGLEIMVNSMELFPEAAFGMTSLDPDRDKPFPFMLTAKESYTYHFFTSKLFHKGPLAAIIRRDAFEALHRFPPGRMISDTDMWHHMALVYPIVLLQDGIVWQRRHADQELSSQEAFVFEGEKIKWKYLLDKKCELEPAQLLAIKKMCMRNYSKFILSGIKRLRPGQVSLYTKCFLYVAKLRIKNKALQT